MNWDSGNLEGLIPIAAGVMGLLMAAGVIPRRPKNPEQIAQWRASYGTLMRVLSPLLIGFGLLQLTGIL